MTFRVSDTQKSRRKNIAARCTNDGIETAVLLGAANFEWCTRRAILCLAAATPTEEIKHLLKRAHGLDAYKDLWRKEVADKCGRKSLPSVVTNWGDVHKAFKLRHKLIHGAQGTTGLAYGTRHVERLLSGAEQIAEYSKNLGYPIFGKRLPVRR